MCRDQGNDWDEGDVNAGEEFEKTALSTLLELRLTSNTGAAATAVTAIIIAANTTIRKVEGRGGPC